MTRYKVGLATRARILEATRAVLAEEGLEGATLKAICERAGVQPGSFYNQFASKDDAVMHIVREAIQAVDPHPDGAADSLGDLVAAYVKFVTGNPAVARIYLQLAVGGGLTDASLGARVLGHHRDRLDRFTQALRRARPGLAAGEARLRVEAMLATLNGLAFQWLLDDQVDLARHAERALATATAG